MNRIPHRRWAAALAAQPSQVKSKLASRSFTSGTATRTQGADAAPKSKENEAGTSSQTAQESDATTSPATAQPSTPSLFDQIFSGPDPFPKADSPSSGPRGRLLRDEDSSASTSSSPRDSPPLPRGVLFDDPRDARARSPPTASRRGGRNQIDRSPLTTSEAAAFNSIFESIWSGDKKRGAGGGSLFSPFDDEKEVAGEGGGTRDASRSAADFGSSLYKTKTLGRGWLELHSYASRNLGARAALRDEYLSKRQKGLAGRGAVTSNAGDGTTPFNPRIAAIRAHNEAAASGYSDREIEEGIDRARLEMAECQTVGQLWEWAAREIWGGRGDDADSGAGEVDDDASVAATTSPRYGLSTPFYAPVLHSLFLALRDRFHSPSSALQVLRLVRALGPSSLVLGTTALLYTEALRTRWHHLADLRGARDLLAEAREIGILAGAGGGRGSASNERRGQVGAGGETTTMTENWSASGEREEKSLRIVVDHVRSEVRSNVLGNVGAVRRREEASSATAMTTATTTARSRGGQVSRLEMPDDDASRQALAIVEEMARLAGYPRRRSANGAGGFSSSSYGSNRGQTRNGNGGSGSGGYRTMAMDRRSSRRSSAFAE